MNVFKFYLKKYFIFYFCFSIVLNIILLAVFESGIVFENTLNYVLGISMLILVITSYFLVVYKLFQKNVPSNEVLNMYVKIAIFSLIASIFSFIIMQGKSSNSILYVPLFIILIPFFPLMFIFSFVNHVNIDNFVLLMINISMWINCVCYYFLFKDQVNLKLNKIHFVRNIMIFVLGYSVVLGMMFLGKEEVVDDNETHTVNLNICDENGKVASYSTSDKESIDSLLNFVGITVKSQNRITYNIQPSLSSGVSYQLDFIGKDTFSYKVINGYCIYNDKIYEIKHYDITKEGILHDFRI